MRYDRPLIVALVGAVATIPYEVFTRALAALGVARYSAYELSSLVITLNRPNVFLGLATSATIGGAVGVLFYYSLRRLGRDYLVFKAIGFALLTWLVVEAVFVWLIEGPHLIPPRPIMDYASHLFGSAVFGATMGLLFQRYLLRQPAR